MNRIRLGLLALGILAGISLNLTVAPQIMTPRPPVFNGADVAENWEWRSMAAQAHSWWLADNFPAATVRNGGYVPLRDNPEGREIGLKLPQWMDEFFDTSIDTTQVPLDVTALDIREDILEHQLVYSRIHCRVDSDEVRRGGCYYFVSAEQPARSSTSPVFVAVLTNAQPGSEEIGLVEVGLLESISAIPIDQIPLMGTR